MLLALARENPDIDLVPLVSLTGNRLQRIEPEGMQQAEIKVQEKVEKDSLPLPLPLLDADVIILDNVDENTLGLSNALSAFAAQHGLLVLAGEGFQAGPALGPILPLDATGDRIVRDLPLELTEDGRSTAIFFDGARNLLADMPPFYAALRTKGLRPDAKLLGQSSDGVALIAYRRNGEGKILEVAGYPLWRAGFSAQPGSHDDLYQFLTNIIRFLALRDIDRFRLSSDQLNYYAGEPISVMLQATSDDGRPWSGLDVKLTTSEAVSGQRSAVSGLMVDRGAGLYDAEIDGLSPGTYTAQAEITQPSTVSRESSAVSRQPPAVSGQPSAIGRAPSAASRAPTITFTVSEQSIELSQSPLNDDLLRRIAAATGAAYVYADSLAEHPPQIHFADYRRVVTFDPRLNRWLFLLIATLFVLEVYLRKRRGMM
jgi:hypothetical protein